MHVKKTCGVMGGMMGGVTGGLMGEMKIEESLYLKGSAPSDGRDGALSFIVNKNQKTKQNCSMFINKKRLFFNTLYFQERSLTGNSALPIWEPAIDGTTISEADCNACSNSMKNDDYEIVEQFLGKDKKTL